MEQPRFIICSQCGAENQPSARVCRMCETQLSGSEQVRQQREKTPDLLSTMTFSTRPEPLVCPSCHEPNDPSYKFCSSCGSNLRQSKAEVAPAPSRDLPGQQQDSASLRSAENAASRPDLIKTVPATTGCPKCGNQLVAGSMFCHKCGQALSAAHTMAIASVRPQPRPRLLLIIEGEQTGDEYELKTDTVIGRINGDITFPHDDYMSGRHARIERRDKKFVLVDEGSRNGSFVRIKKEVEIEPGDMILIGRQVFRFEI